jgi:hypothetical protein
MEEGEEGRIGSREAAKPRRQKRRSVGAAGFSIPFSLRGFAASCEFISAFDRGEASFDSTSRLRSMFAQDEREASLLASCASAARDGGA